VVKRPCRGVDHPPLSSAEVKERLELYLQTFVAHSRVNFTFTLYAILRVQDAIKVKNFYI